MLQRCFYLCNKLLYMGHFTTVTNQVTEISVKMQACPVKLPYQTDNAYTLPLFGFYYKITIDKASNRIFTKKHWPHYKPILPS